VAGEIVVLAEETVDVLLLPKEIWKISVAVEGMESAEVVKQLEKYNSASKYLVELICESLLDE
jgi:hypothetical protein